MVSEKMLEDAADLAERGIFLTPSEVVRLNAFGLRVERGPDASRLFRIRRACTLGDIALHEPTIGHYKWLEEVAQIVDLEDEETWCYTRAYFMSVVEPDDLVAPTDRRAVKKAVSNFAKAHLRRVTLRELRACMEYAEHGADASSGEKGPSDVVQTEGGAEPERDWCSELGVVREAQALGLGISMKDALAMTYAQMRAVVDRAEARICGEDKAAKSDAIGDYNAVLDEIVRAHGRQ